MNNSELQKVWFLSRQVFKVSLVAALLAGGSSFAIASETLRYEDMVRQLTDMEHIAVLPPVGETGALASSYCRASKYDAATDKYIGWNANGDGAGIIRKEGDASVLADIKGPGCIRRMWSASIKQGHVKIYLDGAGTPAVDMPFTGYFDGKNAPFTRPNLVYMTAAFGFNNYTPISFQKSCKVVADKDWGAYFHFNYTQFPEGTVVPTFKLPLSAAADAALDKANRIMGECGEDPAGKRAKQKIDTKSVTVDAGKSAGVIKLTGAQAITGLKVKLDLPKNIEAQRTLLAQLTVRMTWDDEIEPAVWSPLGDFFASAAGEVPFQTLPVGVSADGAFYCYWYMPFGKEARIEVGNDSGAPVVLNWEVTHAPLDKPLESLGRFHAKWHRDAFLPTRPDRAIDWTLLTTQGRGRFVGTQLHVWNPRGDWWGEGDEKFFVDGEKFPSTFGTGSEDYFGYAWSSGNTFVQALHSQPVNENNEGHVSVNRWHIADNIPFQTSFEGDIEKYFTEKERDTRYAAVAYWYLNAGGADPYVAAPVSERAGWWVQPEIYREAGVIEAESLKALKEPEWVVGGDLMVRVGRNIWSGDRQLKWRSVKIGTKVDLEIPKQKAGKYKLIVRMSKGPELGVFQLSLNGKKLGVAMDLFGEKLLPAEPVELGEVELPEGKSILSVELTGKNDASKAMLFGMDYLKLVPVQ